MSKKVFVILFCVFFIVSFIHVGGSKVYSYDWEYSEREESPFSQEEVEEQTDYEDPFISESSTSEYDEVIEEVSEIEDIDEEVEPIEEQEISEFDEAFPTERFGFDYDDRDEEEEIELGAQEEVDLFEEDEEYIETPEESGESELSELFDEDTASEEEEIIEPMVEEEPKPLIREIDAVQQESSKKKGIWGWGKDKAEDKEEKEKKKEKKKESKPREIFGVTTEDVTEDIPISSTREKLSYRDVIREKCDKVCNWCKREYKNSPLLYCPHDGRPLRRPR